VLPGEDAMDIDHRLDAAGAHDAGGVHRGREAVLGRPWRDDGPSGETPRMVVLGDGQSAPP
jgi:hypothetical protein